MTISFSAATYLLFLTSFYLLNYLHFFDQLSSHLPWDMNFVFLLPISECSNIPTFVTTQQLVPILFLSVIILKRRYI